MKWAVLAILVTACVTVRPPATVFTQDQLDSAIDDPVMRGARKVFAQSNLREFPQTMVVTTTSLSHTKSKWVTCAYIQALNTLICGTVSEVSDALDQVTAPHTEEL